MSDVQDPNNIPQTEVPSEVRAYPDPSLEVNPEALSADAVDPLEVALEASAALEEISIENQSKDSTTAETQPVAEPPAAPLDQIDVSAKRRRDARVPLLAITTDGRTGLEEIDVTSQSTANLTDGPAENPNVTYERDYNLSPVKPWTVNPGIGIPIATHMMLLSEQGSDVDARVRNLVTPTMLETHVGNAWNSVTMAGSSLSAQYGMVQSPAQWREGAQFRQHLEHEGSRHSFFAPSLPADASSKDPMQVRIRVRSLMKNGAGVISIPLYHSGFWIMLYAPSESSLYELNRLFSEEKITLGRMTQGLIFSNEQVYMTSWLLEFVIDHVYDATVKYGDKEELRKHISVLDLPILFTGLARLIWPNGHAYLRSVTTKQAIANSTMVEGRLDLAKLVWPDNTYFTTWQKNHFANRTRASYSYEELDRYLKEFRHSAGRTIEVDEKISILLKVPDADTAIRDGDRWISGLITMVDETFTTSRPTPQKRNEIVGEHAGIQEMMRYGSWVSMVTLNGIEYTDREVIEETLVTLSAEESYRKIFDDAVRKFIADCTAAMVAIPEYSGEANGHERFPRLIPLDVVTVFFTLLVQKVAK